MPYCFVQFYEFAAYSRLASFVQGRADFVGFEATTT